MGHPQFLVKIKKGRYQFIGKIMSFLIFLMIFTVVPNWCKFLWPTLINIVSRIGKPRQLMYITVAVGINLLTFSLYNLTMLLIYKSKIPFFQQFRINPSVPWPWEGKTNGQQCSRNWKKTLLKTVSLVLLNTVIMNFIVTFGETLLHEPRYEYSVQSWPKKSTIFFHFSLFFTFNEVVSHLAHWAFHSKYLYSIHKLHHQYTTSISITATYAHPIEYLFSNILSTAGFIPILSLLTKVHLISLMIWISFRLMETYQVHCGYDFPWGLLSFLPGKNKAAFHDFHHSHNSGTFGSMLSVMDKLMGTDKDYKKYKQCYLLRQVDKCMK